LNRKDNGRKSESLLDIDRNSILSKLNEECYDTMEVDRAGFRTILLLRYPPGRIASKFQ
jgi:hypothetical protein